MPTAVRFSPDGRVFVAEKNGVIKVYDNLDGHDAHGLRGPADERRLLGHGPAGPGPAAELPDEPYVYVLYTYDGPIGGRRRALERRLARRRPGHDRRVPGERAASRLRAPTATL